MYRDRPGVHRKAHTGFVIAQGELPDRRSVQAQRSGPVVPLLVRLPTSLRVTTWSLLHNWRRQLQPIDIPPLPSAGNEDQIGLQHRHVTRAGRVARRIDATFIDDHIAFIEACISLSTIFAAMHLRTTLTYHQLAATWPHTRRATHSATPALSPGDYATTYLDTPAISPNKHAMCLDTARNCVYSVVS